MGCPVSTDTAARGPKECHPDGRPLSDVTTEDGLTTRTVYGREDLEEARSKDVPNIVDELFTFGDFQVPKNLNKKEKRPPTVLPAPSRTVTTGQPDNGPAAASDPGKLSAPSNSSGGKDKKDRSRSLTGVVWGEFKMPLIDEIDDSRDSSNAASPTATGLGGASANTTSEPPPLPGKQASRVEARKPPPKPAPRPGYKTIDKLVVKNAIGHSSRVKCIAIAPGEKEYVSCSNEDTNIALFSLQSGRELGMFTGHQDTVINATFSYDGKYLATTSRDHTMILWDVVTTKQILTFEHGKVVICCCFSKDSRYVATGCQDKVCRVWETRKGRETLVFAQHEGIIISMCYSPDSTHIVSASADKTLRVWSSSNGKCKHLLQGHAGIVLACVYTADGKRIVSNDEKLVRVWNAADGMCTLSLSVDDVTRIPNAPPSQRKVTWTLSTAAPGEFGNYLIVASNNRFVYILSAETGEEVTSHFCKAPVYCLAMGHTNRAAVGDSFGNIYHFTFLSSDG